MPGHPNDAMQQAGHKRNMLSLHYGECESTPSKLFHWTEQQGLHQCWEYEVPGRKGKWVGGCPLDRCASVHCCRDNEDNEYPPPRGSSHKGSPAEKASQVFRSELEPNH